MFTKKFCQIEWYLTIVGCENKEFMVNIIGGDLLNCKMKIILTQGVKTRNADNETVGVLLTIFAGCF